MTDNCAQSYLPLPIRYRGYGKISIVYCGISAAFPQFMPSRLNSSKGGIDRTEASLSGETAERRGSYEVDKGV